MVFIEAFDRIQPDCHQRTPVLSNNSEVHPLSSDTGRCASCRMKNTIFEETARGHHELAGRRGIPLGA